MLKDFLAKDVFSRRTAIQTSRMSKHVSKGRIAWKAALPEVTQTGDLLDLMPLLSNEGHLRSAFFSLPNRRARGIDGLDCRDYGYRLERKISRLSRQLKSDFIPQAVRESFSLKPDGRTRPIHISSVRDRIVQFMITEILSQIYEPHFADFSFAYRSGRSPHDALAALKTAALSGCYRFVLSTDIANCFPAVNLRLLMELLRRRIKDERFLELIAAFLYGSDSEKRSGLLQGLPISPVLSNIFLDEVFDQFCLIFISQQCNLAPFRFSDDIVVLFDSEVSANLFLNSLKTRLEPFGLRLSESKTSLSSISVPFDFLGFTHYMDDSIDDSMDESKHSMDELHSSRFHRFTRMANAFSFIDNCISSIKGQASSGDEVGKELKAKLQGHFQYFGLVENEFMMTLVRTLIEEYWRDKLSFQGYSSTEMNSLIDKYLSIHTLTPLHGFGPLGRRERLMGGACLERLKANWAGRNITSPRLSG